MNPVGLDIVEQPLVMRDHHDRSVGCALLIDPARHHFQRVDVETAVGLVENGQTRFEHRHLKDFVSLLLAARKTDIDGALQEILADIQKLELGAHDPEKLTGVDLGLAAVAALRVDRGAQEVHVVHTRDLDRVLERKK